MLPIVWPNPCTTDRSTALFLSCFVAGLADIFGRDDSICSILRQRTAITTGCRLPGSSIARVVLCRLLSAYCACGPKYDDRNSRLFLYYFVSGLDIILDHDRVQHITTTHHNHVCDPAGTLRRHVGLYQLLSVVFAKPGTTSTTAVKRSRVSDLHADRIVRIMLLIVFVSVLGSPVQYILRVLQ